MTRSSNRTALVPAFSTALVLGLVAGATGCTNEGSGLGPGPEETRVVEVGVYLDRDGSRTVTVLDTVFAKARVALFVQGSSDTLKTAVSNAAGVARFTDIALGRYTIAIDPKSIGDSIQVQAIDSTNIRVTAADDTVGSVARLGYPEVSIRQARTLPAGRRVFIRGTILAGVQSFRDTTSHISDSSGQIRLTRVALRGGLSGNSPGDSVSVLGITSSRAGQPTLDLASIARFGTRPAPIPLPVGTGPAATASNGIWDAALVQITGAIISDTVTVAPDFQVTVSDGTGSLEVLLDGNLNFPRTSFRPGRSMNARGVLVPNGVGGWVFKPRELGDVTLN
jgi:hypothetical protein